MSAYMVSEGMRRPQQVDKRRDTKS